MISHRAHVRDSTRERRSPDHAAAIGAPVHQLVAALETREWLPTGTCSGRIVTDVVIDFFEAKKRLRPRELTVPRVVRTLALAEEFRGHLATGGVNQSALAHLYGLTRARVTQILNLLKLHALTLDYIRTVPSAAVSERKLRPLVGLSPDEQLDVATQQVPGFAIWSRRAVPKRSTLREGRRVS